MKRPEEGNGEDAEMLEGGRGEMEGVDVELAVGSREEKQKRAGRVEDGEDLDGGVVDVRIGGLAREELLPGGGGVRAVEEEERSLVCGEDHYTTVIVYCAATNSL